MRLKLLNTVCQNHNKMLHFMLYHHLVDKVGTCRGCNLGRKVTEHV